MFKQFILSIRVIKIITGKRNSMKKICSLLFTICCSIIIFSSCQKDFSNESGSTQLASGSLRDSDNNCLPDTVIGTFYDGVTPGSDTAYVEIQVDVTQTGSYSIYTDFQNGFKFADSGFFTNTGINTVRLKPLGTPILNNTTTFNVSFDSSLCSFTVNVQDSTGTGLGGQDTVGGDPDAGPGQWKFATDSGGNFNGTIFNAHVYPDTLANGSTNGYILNILGSTSTNDSVFILNILLPQNNIVTGTYSSLDYNSDSSRTTGFNFCPSNGADCFYFADGISDASNVNVNINITSYNSATNVVIGTFSGVAVSGSDFNGSGNPTKTIQILKGSFNATVQ